MPSVVINSNLLVGNETALIDLCMYRDVHIGPGIIPIKTYFEKSAFLDTLQCILTTEGVALGGKIGELRSEIYEYGAIADVKNHIIDSDYSDLINISCNEIVPGIFTVCAQVSGETKVSCLRNLDKIVVDNLLIEIVTDYFLLQTGGPISENDT